MLELVGGEERSEIGQYGMTLDNLSNRQVGAVGKRLDQITQPAWKRDVLGERGGM
ncbi:hypothetical protein PSYJA_14192 [Pseudomonas syringae pv. japonica str. M301072]|uniref:Uncharacterized protein n=1 Tax=Pseudomonas syringae pv. japonica str. M301072 TaxID=629262 RepID=F3FIL7_PSESX|nr:hypothetical protein PSYJA_14192 [Pseudomonas syringae pv. japonica str. M301072]